jgi:hypothetical protein
MPNPVCSTCLSHHRAAIETALLEGESSVSVAKRFGLKQTNVARHFRNCVKPKLQIVARAIAPVVMPPPSSPLDVLPSMEGLLKKLGQTIDRAETLVADAESDGGIAGRAVSLNALKGALVDTAKLLAVLSPQRQEPTPEQIDRRAVREALASVVAQDRDDLLDKLLA